MSALTALAMLAALLVPLLGQAQASHPSPDVATIEVTPQTASNPVGGTHTFEVLARDAANNRVHEDIDDLIKFRIVSGPNQSTGTTAAKNCAGTDSAVATDPTHECTYDDGDFAGAGGAGTDQIRVWADNNHNELLDGNEPSQDISKTWFGDPFSVNITPASSSAATGVACNSFTITVLDEGGNPVPDVADIAVRQTHEVDDDSAVVEFCSQAEVDATGRPNPSGGTADGSQQNHQKQVRLDEDTDENGQVSFGVQSDTPGQVQIVAWTAATADPSSPQGFATKTWTATGAAAVTQLTVTPTSASNPTGAPHTFTLTARNAAGDPVPDVIPLGRVESGPNQTTQQPCDDPTDDNGQCTIQYTSGDTGTDNWRFWVNTNDERDLTPGPDAQEPQATASKTWTEPEGDAILLECTDFVNGFQDDNCEQPTEVTNVPWRATVTDDTGTPQEAPVEGARVDFFESSSNIPMARDWFFQETGTKEASCTTNADGQCTVTVVNPEPEHNDVVDLQARIAGTGIDSDLSRTFWRERAPTNLTLEPEFDTNQTGTNHTVVATLTDQFGDPVPGEAVDITSDPGSRNALGTTCLAPPNTNAAGQVTCTYTDHGGPIVALAGFETDDLRASHATVADKTAEKRWIAEPAVAAQMVVSTVSCADTSPPPPTTKTADRDVDQTQQVWARPLTAGGQELPGHEVTFTTNLGNFVGPMDVNLGQSTTATVDGSGCAVVTHTSQQSGTATVTATKDGVSDSATITYAPLDARNITLTPETDTNPPGTTHEITATATDKFGNPVPGVDLNWTRSGAGFVVSAGESPTDAAGQARIVIRSDTESPPDTTVTVTIPNTGANVGTHFVECNRAANVPNPGDPAGNCTATATKTWGDPDPGLVPFRCLGHTGMRVPGEVHRESNPNDPTGVGEIIVGTNGDDVLVGTPGDDVMCGAGGNDIMRGLAGNDRIAGGPGNDEMFGGPGRDRMWGGRGSDTMRGGRGRDVMRGGPGRDVIRGGPGRDRLFGGPGNDRLFGGRGSDRIFGGPGNDILRGGRRPGQNFLHGGRGFDRCFGRPNTIFHRTCNVTNPN